MTRLVRGDMPEGAPAPDGPVIAYPEDGILPDEVYKPSEVRRETNIHRGDVVWYESETGEPVKALVLRVFPHYQERGGYYIPKYRVVRATRAGTWSRQWNYTYPGMIERAYERAAEKETAA